MTTKECPECHKDFSHEDSRGRARKYCGMTCSGLAKRSSDEARRVLWPICQVDDCDKTVRSARQTLCEMHYGRIRRHGALVAVNKCRTCGAALPSMRGVFCSRTCLLLGNRAMRYGMTPSEGHAYQETRNGACDICGGSTNRTLSWDHDHSTGKIRGLLCGKCNSGLGFFDDDPAKLSSAIEYITLGLS